MCTICAGTSLWCASSLHLVHHRPPAFPKPGKITVVSFFQTFPTTFCLCVSVCRVAFPLSFPCLFVCLSLKLFICLVAFFSSVCLCVNVPVFLSVCPHPLCLLMCFLFLAWLSAFCQLASNFLHFLAFASPHLLIPG